MWLLQADLEAYIRLLPATSDQDSLYYKFLDLVYGKTQLHFHFHE